MVEADASLMTHYASITPPPFRLFYILSMMCTVKSSIPTPFLYKDAINALFFGLQALCSLVWLGYTLQIIKQNKKKDCKTHSFIRQIYSKEYIKTNLFLSMHSFKIQSNWRKSQQDLLSKLRDFTYVHMHTVTAQLIRNSCKFMVS